MAQAIIFKRVTMKISTVTGLSSISSAETQPVTLVNCVERSRGQVYRRHAIWMWAIRYDSGMCRPDSHITTGSSIVACSHSLLCFVCRN